MKRLVICIIIFFVTSLLWAEDLPRTLNSRYYTLSCWGEDINEFSMGELLEESFLKWKGITGLDPRIEKPFQTWIFSDNEEQMRYLDSKGMESLEAGSFLLTRNNPDLDILVINLPEDIPSYQKMKLLIYTQINRRCLPSLSPHLSRGISHYLLEKEAGNYDQYLTLWKDSYVDLKSFSDEQNDIFYWGLITYCLESGDKQAQNLLYNVLYETDTEMPRWDNENWQSVLLKMHRYFTLQLTLRDKQQNAIKLFEEKKLNESKEAFLQLENAQVSPLVSYYLSLIYFEQDDYNTSMEYLEASYTQGLQEDLYLYCKGTILWEQGEKKEARELWKKALDKSGGNSLYSDILGDSGTFLDP